MKRLVVLLTVLLAATPTVRAGVILNTLAGSAAADPGWSGGLNGSFEAAGGNTDVLTLGAGGRVIRRGAHDVWRLQGRVERSEADGAETARSVVGHLRQNHHLGGSLHSVAFVQIQHNPFQRLKSRWLGGLGARVDVLDDARGRLALGATHMLEVERIEAESGSDTDHRLSAFLHASRKLSPTVRLTAVGFLQPLWRDFSDRRAMGELSLETALGGGLTLQTGGAVEYDARPPTGVETTDWRTFTKLTVSF